MIRILVVEDDEKLNQIVCTYLNDSGFQAKGCLSAAAAYEEMYHTVYQLIISDIMMPEIDGFEFAGTVRRINETIPILFMSAKDDLPSKRKGFQLGIDDIASQGKYRDGKKNYGGKSDTGCGCYECRN